MLWLPALRSPMLAAQVKCLRLRLDAPWTLEQAEAKKKALRLVVISNPMKPASTPRTAAPFLPRSVGQMGRNVSQPDAAKSSEPA